MHLHDLHVPVQLTTPLGDDEYAQKIFAVLPPLDVHVLATGATEHHVNLMTPAGDRLSIYTTPPASTPTPDLRILDDAGVVVLDLADWTRELATRIHRGDLIVWTDLHDITPDSAWHAPFWKAATVVQCSDDNLPDPIAFLHQLIDDGVRLAICTQGSRGAVAVDHNHHEHRQDAIPCDIIDTNGAGDAFFAGTLAATLNGADTDQALQAGAHQATRALQTRHIGPGVTTHPQPNIPNK